MIKIQIFRNIAGEISGFTVKGHANTAPYGQDIICAAVAALTQTAVLGLERHLGRGLFLDVGEGNLALKLSGEPDVLSGAVLETMLLGLKEVAQISPSSVRITEHRR